MTLPLSLWLSNAPLTTELVAHAAARPTPVPHWAVLVVGVLGLWIAIAGGVAVLDRVLAE